MESFTKGLDPGNLEPMELQKGPTNPGKYQQNRDSNRIIKGYGIAPAPNYQGLGDRDRGRSRSRSKGRDEGFRPIDVANLKALYKDQSFNMLKSPKESESKIRASSPVAIIQERLKKEVDDRPQTQSMYGIARKAVN
jgi:hypothetical protein